MPGTTAPSRPTLTLALQTGAGIERWPVHRSRLRRWVAAALERDARIVLRLVGAREARALNRDFRGRDYATNVLTFAYEAPGSSATAHADVVICLPVLAREARAQRKPLEHHLAHLVVHGVLHAQGMEHDDDDEARVMEQRERVVLRRFRVPDPYAVPVR